MLSLGEDPAPASWSTRPSWLGSIGRGGSACASTAACGSGTASVVSHNGRRVIEQFLERVGLPQPDAILDREKLGAPKDETGSGCVRPVGTGRSTWSATSDDRRMAEKLCVILDVADEPARLLFRPRQEPTSSP